MRLLPTLWLAAAAVALAACGGNPVVVASAFAPAPRKLAVADFDTDLVHGMFPPRPVPEVNAPYQFFRARVAESHLFQLTDDARVTSSTSYLALPTHSRHVEATAGALRAVTLDESSASRLGKELGVDILVTMHFTPRVEDAQSLSARVVNSSSVIVEAEVEAWDANGARVWRDKFEVETGNFVSILGFHSTDEVTNGAAAGIAKASQVALQRLDAKLSGAD